MIVHVKEDSESGDTIATLNINGNTLIKHVKEQIETITGIHKATQCLLHRFDNGIVDKLCQCHSNGKISSYLIKDGSTLVLRSLRRRTSKWSPHGSRSYINNELFPGVHAKTQKVIRYPLMSAAGMGNQNAKRNAAKRIASESAAAKQCVAVPALGESTGASSSQ